jgi:hypothetical protein
VTRRSIIGHVLATGGSNNRCGAAASVATIIASSSVEVSGEKNAETAP